MTQVKPQPTNIAAERAVLAGLCQHGGSTYTDISEFLTTDCFTKNINQNIYKCLSEIFKTIETVDYPTIVVKSKELGLSSLDEQTNQDYIIALFNYKVDKATVRSNASSLRKLHVIRNAQNSVKEIYFKLNEMTGNETLSDILTAVEEPIYSFTNTITTTSDDRTKLLCEDILSYIEHVTQNKIETIGIPSPWYRYNDAIGGGRRRGGVYLTAARPKAGKSTLAINDAIHCAYKLNIPVLYLDTEMTEAGQWPRILAKLSKLPINSIERGYLKEVEIDRLVQVGKDITNMPLYYRKIAGKNFAEIVSIIRNFIVQHVGVLNGKTKDCLVIYDYFKLMDAQVLADMQEYQAMGFQIQELTNLCIKYDIACSAYVQLNRDGITKDTSDAVSQSDRLVWLCSSLAMLKRKSIEEMNLDGFEMGNTKLIVCAEQRYGPGLDENDYVNMMIQRDKCIVDEVCLKSEVKKQNQGFDTNDDEQSESF